MAEGLRIWNSSGQLQVDTSTVLFCYSGSVYTGKSNGSVNVPIFSSGTPTYLVVPDNYSIATPFPTISVSGTTLSWTFSSSGNANNNPAVIYYGAR